MSGQIPSRLTISIFPFSKQFPNNYLFFSITVYLLLSATVQLTGKSLRNGRTGEYLWGVRGFLIKKENPEPKSGVKRLDEIYASSLTRKLFESWIVFPTNASRRWCI